MNPEVRVGQIWKSTDPRDGGRQFRIRGFIREGLPAWAYNYVQDNAPYAVVQNTRTGRRTRILLRRLHYRLAKRGYELVQDSKWCGDRRW